MTGSEIKSGRACDAFWLQELGRATRPGFLAAGFLAAGMIPACGVSAVASAQSAVASAQDEQYGAVQQSSADAAVQANVLKNLATAPELGSEAIVADTVDGVVTLSGTVDTERARTKAENVVANTVGVKKVVDELQLGNPTAALTAPAGGGVTAGKVSAPPSGSVLLSDGTYGPAPAANDGQTVGTPPTPGAPPPGGYQRNNPEADQALDQLAEQQNNPQYGNGTAPNGQTPYPPSGYPQQGGYPAQQSGYPVAGNGYPQQDNGYPQANGGYPQPGYGQQYPQQRGYPQPQPGYPPQGGYAAAPSGQQRPPVWGAQQAGEAVVVPSGVMIRVRVNRLLASNKTQPGTPFDGIVLNDVTAGGFVAIPRGAAVQGTVLDAKASGALSGRGELSIQLTQLQLGGKTYPIVSDIWAHNGGDKTIETINKTAGFGALGAVIGALGGGGVGAAIGGGVGAAAGLGSSAASGRGQVIIPPEGVVSFQLAQPVNVTTVSEQEMGRLAYGVAPGSDPRLARRGPAYPGYYPYGGPGPYGYPNQ